MASSVDPSIIPATAITLAGSPSEVSTVTTPPSLSATTTNAASDNTTATGSVGNGGNEVQNLIAREKKLLPILSLEAKKLVLSNKRKHMQCFHLISPPDFIRLTSDRQVEDEISNYRGIRKIQKKIKLATADPLAHGGCSPGYALLKVLLW